MDPARGRAGWRATTRSTRAASSSAVCDRCRPCGRRRWPWRSATPTAPRRSGGRARRARRPSRVASSSTAGTPRDGVEAHVERAAGAEAEAAVRSASWKLTRARGRTARRRRRRSRRPAPPRRARGSSPGAGPGGRRTREADRRRWRWPPASASRPRTRPSGLAASRIRSVCPPPPTVASIWRLPGAGARVSMTSSGMHRQVPFLHHSSTAGRRIPSGPWKRMWCDVRSPGPRWLRRTRAGPRARGCTRPSGRAPRSRRDRASPRTSASPSRPANARRYCGHEDPALAVELRLEGPGES